MDSDSLSEAAEKAGITRRTLYAYIHNGVDFPLAYMDALTACRERVYRVIAGMMEGAAQPAGVHLKATAVILAAVGDQDKTVVGISRENVIANKGMFDLSIR